MSAFPLAITSIGLVTGVGLNAESSCAAIRCAIDNFQETRFIDSGGEWILGSEVLLEQPWRGKAKLLKMLSMAVSECLEKEEKIKTDETPLLLCLAESDRPGRVIDDDNQLFLDLSKEVDCEFHSQSRVISQGHVSIGTALLRARKLIQEQQIRQVIIAGADGFLVGPTLAHYENNERLLTSNNSNGFIPGDAAAALLVMSESAANNKPHLVCKGLGFGIEDSTIDSDEPLRADGLAKAFKEAVKDAGCEMGDLDFRITDLSGEQYHFKEASLALSRTLRKLKEEFDIWHPADCVGEIGAVMGMVMTGVIDSACRKDYTKGENILFHLGNDDGKRVAMVFTWQNGVAH